MNNTTLQEFTENLENLINDFEDTKKSFELYRRNKDHNKDTLLEFQSDFINLKANLRPYRTYLAGEAIKRDDKSATAIKYRLAYAIHLGNKEGYDPCSINQAEKFASATKEYQKFIEQRTFYKESLTNVTDLKNDMESFINLTKDMLKYKNW